MKSNSPWMIEIVGGTGLVAIVASFIFIEESRRFPGVIALLPTLGTLAVLISVVDARTKLAHLLSIRPLILVGKLSYSIYLWHWPLIVIGKMYADLNSHSQQTGVIIGAIISIFFAVISFYTVEQPLRNRGFGRSKRLILITVGFCISITLCLGLFLKKRVADPLDLFHTPTGSGQLYTLSIDQSALFSTRYYDVTFPVTTLQHSEIINNRGIIHRWGGGNPRILLMGDSHALMYAKLIDSICKQLQLSVAFFIQDGSSVFFSNLEQSFDPIWNLDIIFVVDRWDSLGSLNPLQFTHELQTLIAKLQPHAKKVIIFNQTPTLQIGEHVNLREFVTYQFQSKGYLPKIFPNDHEPRRRVLTEIIETTIRNYSKLQLLHVSQPFYLEDGSIRYYSGKNFLYMDDDHLSDAGAEVLHKQIEKVIKNELTQ